MRNASDLLDEAKLLAKSGYKARAVALAALSVEEVGKALSLCALAGMPESVRAQAPVGRMLEWHQLKQAAGGLIAVTPTSGPVGLAPKLLALREADLTKILSAVEEPADEADRIKRRGMYVDLDRTDRIREPSEITQAEVTSQLDRAGQASDYASVLLDREEQVRVANPPEEGSS